jgi:hypothetical protein
LIGVQRQLSDADLLGDLDRIIDLNADVADLLEPAL